ncbi:MAG: PEP-CTERM sorting domain-containing protein [Burkholderiales bacterium]
MKLKSVFVAASLVLAVSAASATTSFDVGGATLTYDETTPLGFTNGSFSGFQFEGFSWQIPNSATVVNTVQGTTAFLSVDLPSFTLTAKPGYALSDFSAFFGNPTFFDLGGTSNILASGKVSINGAAPVSVSSLIEFQITNQNLSIGLNAGYFSQDGMLPGPFTTFALSDASLLLTASVNANGTVPSIVSNPQNMLKISYAVVAIPEPETGVMLLAGLTAMGWLAGRRRNG